MNKSLVELLRSVHKTHDKNAMEEIINKFAPVLKSTSYKLNYDGAESDLIIYLIETVYTLNPSKIDSLNEGQAVAYIVQSIKNKGIDFYRKRQRQIEEVHSECLTELPDENTGGERVWEYLEFLSEKQRQVVLMKYLYGYSDVEIGEKFGISRQAINKINRKSLEILRGKMEK